jgi:hypothetical protein
MRVLARTSARQSSEAVRNLRSISEAMWKF